METMPEKPMPRGSAQSSTVVAMAPDCVRKAMLPGRSCAGAKVALTPRPGMAMPRQLGPTMRSRCGRAAASIRCARSLPALTSPKPAVRMTAARVPRCPNASTSGGTVSGGVAMTARSGVNGRLATSL